MAEARPRERLIEHLIEHVGFLERSCRAFDEGFPGEAKRLAMSIRVLLHETPASKSLLEQLKFRDRMSYFDTAVPYNPKNLSSTNGLCMLGVGGPDGGSWIAMLDEGPFNDVRKPFQHWWTTTVLSDGKSAFSRKMIMSRLANKEGGGHVDPKLNAAFEAISRQNSLGWMVTGPVGERDVLGDPVAESMRQIAYELLHTLREELAHRLGRDAPSIRVAGWEDSPRAKPRVGAWTMGAEMVQGSLS